MVLMVMAPDIVLKVYFLTRKEGTYYGFKLAA